MSLFWLGEFAAARTHVEQSIALYNSQHHNSHSFVLLQEPKMHCLSFTAWALWFLGYSDQALARMSDALALAQEHPDSYGQAWALLVSSELHEHRREEELALARAEASIALATNLGFPSILAMGTIMRGWALAKQGQGEEGIAQIRRGIAAWQTMGVELQRPHSLALLAEAHGKAGQVEEGLRTLSEALTVVDKTSERFYEAELHRLKGTLTLQSTVQSPKSNVEEEAEGYFLKAIEISRQQQAKSLELRAATSLARLWQSQGKQAEAHKLLSDIYNWFTEGFETKDLQEAKALLDSLASRV
jgi:predicted ATPase